MKILFATSEAVPYIKTGGLGDVTGTLPQLLSQNGHHVVLVLPYYAELKTKGLDIEMVFPTMGVQMGNATLWTTVWKQTISPSLQVYFVEYDEFFNRSPIYDDGSQAYPDNGARFALFSKAALQVAVELDWQPDIAHANDWQTALIPYYLKTWGWENNFFRNTASIYSIHNMAYQGLTELDASDFIGLNWMQMRTDEFESMGQINMMKGAIFYADQITTVSGEYANEILSEPGACGLSTYTTRRSTDITGILNGVDTEEWNPATDTFLPKNFDTSDLSGKAVCKQRLQERLNLNVNPDVPVFGVVSRFAYQKGLDLLKDCIHEILGWEVQFAILGSGASTLELFFGDLPKYYPGKVGAYVGFDSELAHLIEAGADFFVMPSRYEPCGLNQMYSLLYGTLPIVRATGGLYDTVENYHKGTQTGTGFLFNDPTADALKGTIGWALHTWFNEKEDLKGMQIRGMQNDFSWERSTREYIKVYEKALWRRSVW